MVKPPFTSDDHAHEHTFTADVVSWIALILDKDPTSPFASAKFDSRSKGSQQRRDLSLLGKDGKVLVTGEIKLPYNKDGSTPYISSVVSDARRKAVRASADYFFTWNVNECVLWRTDTPLDDPQAAQHYRAWKIASVAKESHLRLPGTEDAIKRWLGQFLSELGKLVRGFSDVGFKLPDERFVEALESALNLPIRLTHEELERAYKFPRRKGELDQWMRDDQGWTIAIDAEGVRDNLERAAKFACYALVNRLVFYEALMKRYGAQLHRLTVGEHIDTGDALRLHLEGYFAEAKRVTGDYETVFGENHSDIGNRIPFYSDFAVKYWRELISQIHEFDFSKLDYEIIGSFFERLISPDERHKFGQYYTRAEVVDLINSFCIRTGEESVIDPACGGGTFLVRAYARKRELAPGRSHEKLLAELYGVDISPFACHLTTINLATRDLVEDENYPLIARGDFFDVLPKTRFLSLPSRAKSKGLGKNQHRDIEIPPLDGVIGNPPYVRQEEIKSYKATGGKAPRPNTKEFYRALVKREAQSDLSGRSDLHCYFWPHAFTFLKTDGWLCFLTSSQWLDVEYGFKLQNWILSRFKIVAIFESVDEPWFVGARVVTTITILQRCDNIRDRDKHHVRFVQLRQPIGQLLAHDGTTAGAIEAADRFRDEILALQSAVATDRFRARLVPQRELLAEGIHLGKLMRGEEIDDVEESDDSRTGNQEKDLGSTGYYGGKWGIHLRAPDLWFELMDRCGGRFRPLGELTDVRFGVKSGKDGFFFPRDASDECLEMHPSPFDFKHEFGVSRERVESGDIRLVKSGDSLGELHPIESRFLEPEVHSLMEVDGFKVGPEDCSRMIFLASDSKNKLRGTNALRYIEWGESNGWHKTATCAARIGEHSFWYDLTKHKRPHLILPKIQQYRLQAFINPSSLYQNSSLLGIHVADATEALKIGAILNSSFAVLSRILFARVLGNEGTIQLDVYSAKMMVVPSPTEGAAQRRAIEVFRRMLDRPTLQFLSERRMRRMALVKSGRESELDLLPDHSELDMEDRRELDDAILEMIGIKNRRERAELINGLYRYLREFFEEVRQKEEKAIVNKGRSKQKSAQSAAEIAGQVFADVKDKSGHLLRAYRDFMDLNRPYDTFDLPSAGAAEIYEDIFTPEGAVRFMKGRKQIALIPMRIREQAGLVVSISKRGVHGLARVPSTPDECIRVKKRFEEFSESRERQLRSTIADRTGDPDLQDKILAALDDLINREMN